MRPISIIIEIEGGIVKQITSEEPIRYVLVDWDNIDAGDDFPEEMDLRDDIVLTDSILESLVSMRINNILKYDGNEDKQS